MFLIDSSAWIEYLRPKGLYKAKTRVKEILEKEDAVSCGIIDVEVLRGAQDGKTFRLLKDTLLSIPHIPLDEPVIARAAEWGFLLDRKGKGVPTTDLFIASASYGKATVLHIDGDFETISSIVGLKQEKIPV